MLPSQEIFDCRNERAGAAKIGELGIGARVAHPERREDRLAHECSVGLAGNALDDPAQDLIAGVAVRPFFARPETEGHVGELQDVVAIGDSGRVREEMVDRHAIPGRRRFGKIGLDRIGRFQLAPFLEQEDRGRGELLGQRADSELRHRRVALAEQNVAVARHQHRSAELLRAVRRHHPFECLRALRRNRSARREIEAVAAREPVVLLPVVHPAVDDADVSGADHFERVSLHHDRGGLVDADAEEAGMFAGVLHEVVFVVTLAPMRPHQHIPKQAETVDDRLAVCADD